MSYSPNWPVCILALIFLSMLPANPMASMTSPAPSLACKAPISPERPAMNRPFDYDFKVRSLDGHITNFAAFRDKIVFLNLWATWCGPCRFEMYSIQKLFEEAGQDVEFVLLSIDNPNAANRVKTYIDSNDFTFPVYMPSGDLTEQLKVNIIPTTFIVGRNGEIALYQQGERNYNSRRIKNLLESLKQGTVNREKEQ